MNDLRESMRLQSGMQARRRVDPDAKGERTGRTNVPRIKEGKDRSDRKDVVELW
jgi:hypothetical protein